MKKQLCGLKMHFFVILIQNFKISGEKQEKSMFEWLKNLPIHQFTQRHFEADESNTSSPLHITSRIMNSENCENQVENENL